MLGIVQSQSVCPDCHGDGKIVIKKCHDCKGQKYKKELCSILPLREDYASIGYTRPPASLEIESKHHHSRA